MKQAVENYLEWCGSVAEAMEKNGAHATFLGDRKTLDDLRGNWALMDRQLHFWDVPCECYEGNG